MAAVPGLGVGTATQREPFQCSRRVREPNPPFAPQPGRVQVNPPAQASSPAIDATAVRALPRAPGFGAPTPRHRAPSKWRTSGRTAAPRATDPTAQTSDLEEAATPRSVPNPVDTATDPPGTGRARATRFGTSTGSEAGRGEAPRAVRPEMIARYVPAGAGCPSPVMPPHDARSDSAWPETLITRSEAPSFRSIVTVQASGAVALAVNRTRVDPGRTREADSAGRRIFGPPIAATTARIRGSSASRWAPGQSVQLVRRWPSIVCMVTLRPGGYRSVS